MLPQILMQCHVSSTKLIWKIQFFKGIFSFPAVDWMVKKQNVTPLVSDDPDHWGDETTQPSQCMVGEVSPS